ncbi:MAG: DUF1015 domain-containing protein [Clostridia bacterium]|nr:DUF1015 domain-containing protein [Clostridia bacterium]
MANLKAFKGYRYNTEKVGEVGDKVSPPYYNISDEEKDSLYNLSEYNSVRLFCGKNYADDNEDNNKSTRAANFLQDWIGEGVLKRDDEDAIYMYEEVMTIENVQINNRSFVSLVELEELDEGVIMPCEEIREVSRQDRYDYLTATNADMSMISCLYVEREKELLKLMNDIAEETPDMDFVSNDSIHHRVWVITYKPTIDYIIKQFSDLPLYITDGQTRYETCLQYRDYMKSKNPNHTGKEPYNYVMMSLMNSKSDGIVLQPVHRELKCPKGFKLDYFVSASQDHFKIEKIIVDHSDESFVDTMKKQIATKRLDTKIALYCGGDFFYRLTLKDKDYLKNSVYADKSQAYCGLDNVVFNKLILDDILHITPENYEERVFAQRNPHKCYEDVVGGEFDAMFMLNSVKIDQIRKVTEAGEKMPRYTLSVFPKPAVGVLINIKED